MLTPADLLTKLSPVQRRRLLLARISNQRGFIELHRNRWTLLYRTRDINARNGWRLCRQRLDADSYKAAQIEAARFLAKINARNQPGVAPAAAPTFEEFTKREWKGYLDRRGRALSTIASYESTLKKHVLPYIGAKRLHHINPGDISRLLELAGREMRPKSLQNLYGLLKVIFEVARQHDLISDSPVRSKIHRVNVDRKEKPVLSSTQLWQVISSVAPEYRLIFIADVLTGYRRSQLLALRWENIDEVSGKIKPTHKLYKGKLYEGAKTAKSLEPMKVARDLSLLFTEHKDASPFRAPSDYVFCRSDGRPYDEKFLLEKVWYPALKRCGIEPGKRTHGFHLLRHSAATILAELTQNVVLVRDFLRHTELQTTSGYVHLGEDLAGGASEALANELLRKGEGVN